MVIKDESTENKTEQVVNKDVSTEEIAKEKPEVDKKGAKHIAEQIVKLIKKRPTTTDLAKFLNKVGTDLMQKGLKYAEKYNMIDVEDRKLISEALKSTDKKVNLAPL
jgi:hypothetical protein